MILTRRILATGILVGALFAPTLHAEVASVKVTERLLVEDGRTFGDTGTYEQITGKITFAFDPANPLNQVIVGLDGAKRNSRGMVEATGDLMILRPTNPQRGNGVALIDVANRGRVQYVLSFNRGGSGPYGDGFLMREGYTVVWVGWEFDAPSDRPIRLDVPSVDGFPVGGLVSPPSVTRRRGSNTNPRRSCGLTTRCRSGRLRAAAFCGPFSIWDSTLTSLDAKSSTA